MRRILMAALVVAVGCRGAEPPAPNHARPAVTIERIDGSNPLTVTGVSNVHRALELRVRDQYGDLMEAAPIAPAPDERAADGAFRNEVVLTRDPGTFVMVEVIDPAEPVQGALARATAAGSADVVPRVLFFPRRSNGTPCSAVAAVERRIPKSAEVSRVLVEALLEGPTELERMSGFTSPFPPGTRIRSLVVKDGVVSLDFNERIANADDCATQAIEQSVRQTLLAIPSVSDVRISK